MARIMISKAKRSAERSDAIPWQKRPHLRMDVAADVTGLSRTTIYRLASEGRLQLKRLAGRVVVETAGVLTLVANAEPWRPGNRGAAARAKRSEAARAALR
ncbi:hypothetical protein [Methylobacterium sp. 13MFTsu3.1M2]|uniref:hypothetical protein n=1 Tax=Methylobacterium sp. 13MFTsu3.1M2 TaxID=1502776 RepID=UPI001114825A|nr:hypothetical protein [Methylobacterium sp. 13MFTsu3.1M2]